MDFSFSPQLIQAYILVPHPVFSQSAHFALSAEPLLGLCCDFQEQCDVIIPDASIIGTSGFILVDERGDFVAEGLLQQEDTAQATVVVGEGVDVFEGDVELQEFLQVGGGVCVGMEQVGEGSADVLWRDARGGSFGTEAAGAEAAVEGGGGAGGEDGVIAFDEGYGQRLHDSVEHGPDAAEVIDCLHQVVHLHRLEGRGDLACPVDLLHLFPGQTVAGHTVRVVGQLDLDVLVDAEVVVALPLVTDAFGQHRKIFLLDLFASAILRLLAIFGDQPGSILSDQAIDPSLAAIPSDQLF